jgi:hypothetical protein
MHTCQKTPVFRIFSANHWNQSEITLFKIHLTVEDPIAKKAPILFSNAEKLRKTDLLSIINITQESIRTIQSIGLRILFPIIPIYFNLQFSSGIS